MTLKIALVLPYRFAFSAAGATAIDLCARDFAAAHGTAGGVTVFGSPVAEPFNGVAFVPVEARSRRNYAKRIAARLAAHPPDVVLVEQRTDLASALARALPAVPVAVRRHGRTERHGVFKRLRHRLALAPIGRFIWVSRYSAASFVADYPGAAARVRIVANGIDTGLWQPAPVKEPIIAFAGRAAEEKGLATFAAAAAALLAANAGWRAGVCVSIRSAAERGYADGARAALAAVADRVEWRENATRDDVRHLFARAAIVVIPSNVPEGFPLAAIEAMASGAALVHCGSGGLPEVTGDTAVVPAERDANGYVEAMQRLIADADLRTRTAAAGRARVVDRFTIAAVTAELDGLLAELVAERRASLI